MTSTQPTVSPDDEQVGEPAVAPPPGRRRTTRARAVPYLLLAPTLIYLAMFFAYPMFEGVMLAIYDDDAVLPLLGEPSLAAEQSGELRQGSEVAIVDRQGTVIEDEVATDLLTEQWFRLEAEVDGQAVSGWSPESRVRVRAEADDGTPESGSVRPRLGAAADELTPVYAEPNEDAAIAGELPARTEVAIAEVRILEVWFEVQSEQDPTTTGWAPSRFITTFGEEGETGRVSQGSAGEFTTQFIRRMLNEAKFDSAWQTTLLLIVLILPLQFVLAMVMALIIDARLKAGSGFLYVFSLPMGMSDLAVGILFFAIFTRPGLLNSMLEFFGVTDDPQRFLTADTRGWIIFAIVMAELWRATSIVMVILVSGLQAIPRETLEAAELFGASYWQRVRTIVLPLLKPSIQVALILRTILAFQVFAVVIALSGGDIVTVLANETFRQYFEFRNNNVASAYALFILLLSMGSAVFYLRAVKTQSEVKPT